MTERLTRGLRCHTKVLLLQSGNGTVTWLIEFKQFESITTGSDITVEVTCETDEADSLEPLESVYDDRLIVCSYLPSGPVAYNVYVRDL